MLLVGGLALLARLWCCLVEHKQFYRTPTSDKNQSLMVGEKDHSIIMPEHENENIVQTTKMTKHNPLHSLSDCCFFTNYSFSTDPFLLTSR